MCNAVASDVDSDKIEENNCSDETNPNIIMTDSNIESIMYLDLSYNNISKITGIEYFTSLTDLRLYSNQITDLTPLKDLTSLTSLSLSNNQITDLTPLKDLTSLTRLDLSNNQITDLTPLSNLTNLTNLDLSSNQISDLSPLKNLTSLPRLNLAFNQISDLTPLASLTELNELVVVGNPFNDIDPILLLDLSGWTLGFDADSANISNVIVNSKEYMLPSLFLFYNGTLDVQPVANWVTEWQDIIREGKAAGLLELSVQNADIDEDGKNITILDTTKPAEVNVYVYVDEDRVLLASLTVIYEEPVDPTNPTDDPAVPDTGESTQESSAAILTATLCILSGIILTAIPMTHRYLKNGE